MLVKIVSAAEKKAKEIGQPMNTAVADKGGHFISHVRMDGARLGSIDVSIKKGYTSRAFDIATKDLATHSQSGGQFFGIHASNDGTIMTFPILNSNYLERSRHHVMPSGSCWRRRTDCPPRIP